jgi:hypothetical protein
MPTVRTLYTAMMVLLAKATDRELARMVSYLKEENKVLRGRLPQRLEVTPKERERLLRFGRHLGKAIHKVVTIVSPSTFLRWLREEKPRKARAVKRGRPKSAEVMRELIIRMPVAVELGRIACIKRHGLFITQNLWTQCLPAAAICSFVKSLPTAKTSFAAMLPAMRTSTYVIQPITSPPARRHIPIAIPSAARRGRWRSGCRRCSR